MAPVPSHQLFVTTDGGPSPAAAEDGAPLLVPPVNAHRRLRGPYTAAGTILRGVVPGALERFPELVAAHVIEILSVSPELHRVVPASRETLTSLAIPKERTRFYSRMRTLRIAHGLTDFLRELVELEDAGPRRLQVEHLDQADRTDQELFAVLLRRLPPELLALSVYLAEAAETEPPLSTALDRYPVRHTVGATVRRPDEVPPSAGTDPVDLARAHVAGECLATDPALRAAYAAAAPDVRARLHDQRAAELEATGEGSYRLGAVPFHREHGSDPRGAGVQALLVASDWCIENGFYDATVDLARRGLALVDPADADDTDPLTTWWPLTTKVTMSLAALDRAAEAMAMYDAVRARTTLPRVHMHAAYATAMLYTRHLPEDRRDHRIALGWTNIAIAFASQLDSGEDQAFSTVFQQNGRALVEGHLGNAEQALALVTGGLERLDRELGQGEHGLHRSVLRHNRAQVLKGLGRLEEASEDYRTVIALDPNYAEYHFEYAGLLRRLGHQQQALDEYTLAMRLTPPFVELYYNRGDLRAVTGDVDGALADFGYALELDPDYVDARVNRAALLLDLGELEGAARDVAAGLALAPDNPHLRSQQARVHWENGDHAAALAELDEVVRGAPAMAEAWALRAAVRFDSEDHKGALADLDRSLEIQESAVVRYNRGAVYEALGQWADAAEDYTHAIAGDPEDPDSRLRRAVCRLRTGDREAARADLDSFLALAPERRAEAEQADRSAPAA